MWAVVALSCVIVLWELVKRRSGGGIGTAPAVSVVELRFVEPTWAGDGRKWSPICVGDRMITSPWPVRSAIECGLPPTEVVTQEVIDAFHAHLVGYAAQLEEMAASRPPGAPSAALLREFADQFRRRMRTPERTLLIRVDAAAGDPRLAPPESPP